MHDIQCDVCVVGGGPAGAVAAFRLAKWGHRVVLVERQVFPRPHVGESLSAGVWPLLDSLGLLDAATRARPKVPRETLICWSEARPRSIEVGTAGGAWMVERERLDSALLEAARRVGVCVIQPARAQVNSIVSGWRIEARAAGESATILATQLIDAGGRKGCRPGPRIPFAPATIALWATIETEDCSVARVEAVPEGWLWAAPVRSRRLSMMFFCDPTLVRHRAGRDVERLLREKLARTSLFSGYAQAPFIRRVAVCDATCSYAEAPAGRDYVKIGEASYSVDPLSSSGVEKALQTSVAGAVIAHTLLSDPDRASLCAQFCENRQAEAVDTQAGWAAQYYGAVERFAETPFWAARRRAPALASDHRPRIPVPIRPPASTTRVRLAPEVTVSQEPCIVDEEIASRPALRSPAMSRPVAFVDRCEVVSLLTDVSRIPTWQELLCQWSERLPSRRAEGLATWLWQKRILCEATGGDPD